MHIYKKQKFVINLAMSEDILDFPYILVLTEDSLYFVSHPSNSIRQFELSSVNLGTEENSLRFPPHTGNGKR
jgi:hypothetical protein